MKSGAMQSITNYVDTSLIEIYKFFNQRQTDATSGDAVEFFVPQAVKTIENILL